MTTAAARKLHSKPLLDALLDREFSEERLTSTLDLEAPLPEQLWERGAFGPTSLDGVSPRKGVSPTARLDGLATREHGANRQPSFRGSSRALHLGSLIVDDIEDGSPIRRGGPALHLQIGTPLALNAGNWLYFLPGLLVSRLELPQTRELSLRQAIEALRVALSLRAGARSVDARHGAPSARRRERRRVDDSPQDRQSHGACRKARARSPREPP